MNAASVDWPSVLHEAATSPLGILALVVIVMLFITLGAGKITATQRFSVILSVILLAAVFGILVLKPPSPPTGSSVCLLRNTTLSRTNHVRLPGTDTQIELINTQVGRNGPQARGATLSLKDPKAGTSGFYVEGGHDEITINGHTYQAEISGVQENTIVLSLCRTL